MKSKYGPAESQETKRAVQLFKAGKTAMEACFLTGITPSTLYRAIKRRNGKQ